MTLGDVIEAQMVMDVGNSHPVGYDPDERRRVAIHEAGHALAAVLTGREVKLASILRRGGALGLVSHRDAVERHLKTPTEGLDLMAVALAGRAAEIQEFGEASSGIASDLSRGHHDREPARRRARRVGQPGQLRRCARCPAPATSWPRCSATSRRAPRWRRCSPRPPIAPRAWSSSIATRSSASPTALCVHDELDGAAVHGLITGAVSPA